MEPRVPQNLIRAGDTETLAMDEKRRFCHAFLIKPSVFMMWYGRFTRTVQAIEVNRLYLKKDGDDQDRQNIDDFDHRIDCRPGGVFIRIAHRITSDCCGMSERAFATEISFLNKFLRVIPCGPARCHRDGDE